jgi:N-acetyl-anhydromuramyl-L-alanine amidase AmpD
MGGNGGYVNPARVSREKMQKVNKIILHCSASDAPGQDAAMIREWHLARGFSDIGYHYFIQSNGKLEQGRCLETVGAHCHGENHDSIGICLAGLRGFSMKQFDTLRTLLASLKPLYPKATVHGHHEFNPGKTCPVFDYVDLITFWKNSFGSR